MSSSSATAVAAQVLAYFGAVFWSIQLIPQIILNYRRGHTIGLHQSMMLWWSLAGLPLALHNILGHQPIALQVQAEILTGLSLITWSQVMYYSHSWSKLKCSFYLVAWITAFASIQAATIAGIRYSTASGQAPQSLIKTLATLSAAALFAGVLRHYLDIYQERTVRGISWIFVFLDAMGDLTSLLSIVLVRPLDVYATVIYASELALWLGMAFIGVVFTIRERRQDKQQSGGSALAQEAPYPPSLPPPATDTKSAVSRTPPAVTTSADSLLASVLSSSFGTSVFTRIARHRQQRPGTRRRRTHDIDLHDYPTAPAM